MVGEETGMSGNLMANTKMNKTENTPKWLSVLITSLSHPQKQWEPAQVLQWSPKHYEFFSHDCL